MAYAITVRPVDTPNATSQLLVKPNPYEHVEKISAGNGSLLMVVSMLGVGVVCAPYAYTIAGSLGCPVLILLSLVVSWAAAVQLVSHFTILCQSFHCAWELWVCI